MRISAKGRYALTAMCVMAQQYGGGCITVLSIAERLGISKIYLEQVFSLLKRAGLVDAVKGAQGGYQLTRPPEQTTALEVLEAVELAFLEKTEETVPQMAPELEAALRERVFDALDEAIRGTLAAVSLEELLAETEKHQTQRQIMYFI